MKPSTDGGLISVSSSSGSPSPSQGLLTYILLAICLTRLGTSLYLPALPTMKMSLGVSVGALNATLTLFFVSFAAATLVAGPLADNKGRRWVILRGLMFFVFGSLLCGFAHSIAQLWVGRLLQAIGVAFVPVAARALVRDAWDSRQMLSVLGWISLISSIGPVLAAVLGGFIVEHAGWQATFHLLSVGGIAVLLVIGRRLPETLPVPQPLGLGTALRSYGRMFTSGSFSLVVLPMSFCFVLQGVYLACAPYIFVSIFKLSPSAFGLCNLVPLAALLFGRQLSLVIEPRYGPYISFVLPGILTATAGAALALFLVNDAMNPVTFLAATSLYSLGFGAIIPIGMRSVLTTWKEEAGKASALFGFSTFGAMAIGSAAAGAFGPHPEAMLPAMTWLTLGFGVAVLGSASLTKRYFPAIQT